MGNYDSKPFDICENLKDMPSFNVRLKECRKKIITDNSKVERIEHSSLFGITYKSKEIIKIDIKETEETFLKIDYYNSTDEMKSTMIDLIDEFKKKYDVENVVFRISRKFTPPSDFTQVVSIMPKYFMKYSSCSYKIGFVYCS